MSQRHSIDSGLPLTRTSKALSASQPNLSKAQNEVSSYGERVHSDSVLLRSTAISEVDDGRTVGSEYNDELREQWINEFKLRRKLSEHAGYEQYYNDVLSFCESLPIFRDVVRARSWFWKVVWAVLAFVSLGIWANESIGMLSEFANGVTNTRISYIRNASLSFPSIAICTYARVNQTKIQHLAIDEDLLTYMLAAFSGTYLFYNDKNQRMDADMLEYKYQQFLIDNGYNKSSFSLADFFLEYGFECKQFLANCIFQGTDFDCCDTGIELLSSIGKCFVVKPPKAFRQQKIPGTMGGLKVFLRISEDDYPTTLMNSNPDAGAQVHIVHPSRTSYITPNPIVVPPYTHALVELTAASTRLRPSITAAGTKSCVEEGEIELTLFETYTYEGCFVECVAGLTKKTCSCIQIGSIPDVSRVPQEELCQPSTATVCVQPLLQANNMGYLWEMYDITKECACPIPCIQWSYDTKITYSGVPSDGYFSGWNDTIDAPLKSFAVLDLFFPSLVYQVFDESEIQTRDVLIANLGGQMSVWLGVRLVTFVQVIKYAIITLTQLVPVWIYQLKHEQVRKMVAATRQAAKKAAQATVGTTHDQGSNHSQSTPMPGTGESLTPLSPISSTMPEESFQQKRSLWMQQHRAVSLAKRWSNAKEHASVYRETETKDSTPVEEGGAGSRESSNSNLYLSVTQPADEADVNEMNDSRRPSVLQVSFDTAALAHSRSSELNPEEMNALAADTQQKSEYSKTMYI